MRYLLEHNGACKFFGALAMTTYAVVHTHIDLIRPGDTVRVDGHLKTVSPGDIRKGYMGTTDINWRASWIAIAVGQQEAR